MSWISATAIGSMPTNGSSSSMNEGWRTSARVISTRLRSPRAICRNTVPGHPPPTLHSRPPAGSTRSLVGLERSSGLRANHRLHLMLELVVLEIGIALEAVAREHIGPPLHAHETVRHDPLRLVQKPQLLGGHPGALGGLQHHVAPGDHVVAHLVHLALARRQRRRLLARLVVEVDPHAVGHDRVPGVVDGGVARVHLPFESPLVGLGDREIADFLVRQLTRVAGGAVTLDAIARSNQGQDDRQIGAKRPRASTSSKWGHRSRWGSVRGPRFVGSAALLSHANKRPDLPQARHVPNRFAWVIGPSEHGLDRGSTAALDRATTAARRSSPTRDLLRGAVAPRARRGGIARGLETHRHVVRVVRMIRGLARQLAVLVGSALPIITEREHVGESSVVLLPAWVDRARSPHVLGAADHLDPAGEAVVAKEVIGSGRLVATTFAVVGPIAALDGRIVVPDAQGGRGSMAGQEHDAARRGGEVEPRMTRQAREGIAQEVLGVLHEALAEALHALVPPLAPP